MMLARARLSSSLVCSRLPAATGRVGAAVHDGAGGSRSHAGGVAGAVRRLCDRSAASPRRPTVRGTAGAHSLDGVQITSNLREALRRPGVSEALEQQGFAVVPDDFRLFHFAYQGNVYEGWPVFVTTDVAYHEWHLLFDKLLRSLEQDVLLPNLETLVPGLVQAAHAQTAEVAGQPVEDAASRVEQLFQVAAAELGLPVTLGPLAQEGRTSSTRTAPRTSARR